MPRCSSVNVKGAEEQIGDLIANINTLTQD
jgi:hypothetical protein